MRGRELAWGLALWMAAVAAAPGATLDYRGQGLSSREAGSLTAEALRAPRDSLALRRALGRVVQRLEERGYLDARARGTWEGDAPPRLRLEVEEGPRYRLRELRLQFPAGEDSALLGGHLGLEPGGWASPTELAAAIERALRQVVDRGYPYAYLGVSHWEPDSAGVVAGVSGALGPRVIVSQIRFEGIQVTQARMLERAVGRLTGEPFSRAAAEAGRRRLVQLGLFRSVALEGLEGESDWSRGRLVYRVEERRYNRFEGALGVQGDAGTVGLLHLDLGNLLGTGRAVGLSWEARGRGVSRLGARYAEPLVLGAPLRLEAAFDQQVQDTLYVRTRWGARAGYALSAQERIEAGFEQERVVQEKQEVEEARIQNTVFALERSTLDSPLGPRRGSRVRIEAQQSFKSEHLRPTGKRSARSSAVELRSEWNLPLGAGSGLALELHGAGRFSSQRVLPLYERYPVGGATSLRGYDEEAFRVDRYALARLEWRWFLGAGDQRVFLFWDHARMGSRLALPEGGDRFDSFDRDGIGFGLRLETAGGLVGLSYGLEPGRPPLEGKIHVRMISTF